ncbi:hypothetical protein CC1G_09064 [Coprinopsis cinerea okayama7|uniref:MYND-type domain-containing protein n=1 Tax=Coprinopsis cinerea (strain Okayama-7 / 130 / ATCC MYA-4618 / FGSC 9003) TaxID=240176 RepID=A8P300_COPC7|nr:hypothetical protein CC1G_09064 [Coprinopsis cinerea okayama7\|eukprot:XP_001838436.2 hypothetical protein CC1G_09064 [Coprinopsis cinerea okayama7\
MSKISPQVIADAKDGARSALRALANTLTKDNYVLSALDATLVHLRPESLPTDSRTEFYTMVTFPMEDVFASLTACVNSSRFVAPSNKEGTVSRLLAHLQGILSWIVTWLRLTLKTARPSELGEVVHPLCYTVVLMIQLDDKLRRAILLSRTSAELLRMAWLVPLVDNHGRPLLAPAGDTDLSKPDAIVTLLNEYVLSHPEIGGWKMFLEQVMESDLTMDGFCKNFVARVELLPKERHKFGIAMETIQEQLVTLGFTIALLVDIKPLHQRLVKMGILRKWASAIVSLQRELIPRRRFLCATQGLRAASQPHQDPIRGAADVINTGILPLITEGLINASKDDYLEEYSSVRTVYILKAISYHPRTLRALVKAIRAMPPGATWSSVGAKSKLIADTTWKAFTDGINDRFNILTDRSRPTLNLCDNELHVHADGMDRKRSKKCGRCHSVVYCSSACQHEDWERRHQRECKGMARAYRIHEASHLHYGQNSRTFHVQLARMAFLGIVDELDATVRSKYPTRSRHECIVLVDMNGCLSALDTKVDLLPISDYLAERKKFLVPGCTAIDGRADAIYHRFLAGNPPENRVLVLGTLGYNPQFRITTLLELENREGDWVTINNVARFE